MEAFYNTRRALGRTSDSAGWHRRRISRTTRQAVGDLRDELGSLFSELEAALQDGATEDVRALRAQLRGSVAAARSRLSDASGAAKERIGSAFDDAQSHVRQHPWQAVATLAGIALLTAAVLAINNSRD
ncbi:MAG: DUF883 family protein [Janthinobacterium lividum]